MTAHGHLLVIGASSLIGSTLFRHPPPHGPQAPTHGTVRHPPTDTSPDPDRLSLLDLSQPIPPHWNPPPNTSHAIVCAAATRLEECRQDPAATRRINVTHTLDLIRRLLEHGIFVVYPSSNLVFDGSTPAVHASTPTCPRTEYGRHKAAVEQALLAEAPHRSAIVRLTKVLPPAWPLVGRWMDDLRNHRPVAAFQEAVCAPIPLSCVVDGLSRIAREQRPGIWQFSAPADITYADLARHLAFRIGAPGSLVHHQSTTREHPPEHIPPHSTLDTSRATAELQLSFPTPREAIDSVFFPR